jgi:ubiquinone/menaquinone biosynthesis C-methylase UbiE
MSDTIDFDRAAQAVERLYLTPDVVGQRIRFLDALALRPGERVLDVGVGPGLLAYDMAATVGKSGFVAGIDLSESMLAMTRQRCAEQPWSEFRLGDATKLPFEDASFDALTSTQVYEYVPDMRLALAEAHRVLRPGGRIWIIDTDWDSFVCATSDPALQRRVLEAWDEHLYDPHLPATLGVKLRDAGFHLDRVETVPMLNTTHHAHTYGHGILSMIAGFVSGRGDVTPQDAERWADDIRQRGQDGAYFFSVNRYLFGATRR